MVRLGLVALLSVVAVVPTHRGETAMNGAHGTGGMLAVVNQTEHSVLFVDVTTHETVGTVQIGVNGHEAAASPDGKTLFVPIYGNAGVGRAGTDGSTIDVIDVASRKLVRTIELGRALRPHKAVFGPDGMLYVSGELADAVLVVEPKSGRVVGEVPTGAQESHMFALTKDGKRAYSANVGGGTVSVMDVAGRKTIAVIPVSKKVQRMALSNDERWVFTSDQEKPEVAVIDTATNKVSRMMPTMGIPYVTMPTPDGKYLLVAESTGAEPAGAGVLEVFDLATWKAVKSLPLPCAQNGGFVVHEGKVYLSEPLGGRIEVVDLKTMTLEKPIVKTLGVDGLAWVE
jgi:YVTN family beta-propeller protein